MNLEAFNLDDRVKAVKLDRVHIPSPKDLDGCFVGIDPGFDGGMASIYRDGSSQAWPMPTRKVKKKSGVERKELDVEHIAGWFKAWPVSLVVVEEVNANPMAGRVQGTTSMFRFGQGYGMILGILGSLGIPFVSIHPKTWKKQILEGTDKDKQAAIDYCGVRFPDVSLLASKRCRIPHDGMADALCLAELARRLRIEG